MTAKNGGGEDDKVAPKRKKKKAVNVLPGARQVSGVREAARSSCGERMPRIVV